MSPLYRSISANKWRRNYKIRLLANPKELNGSRQWSLMIAALAKREPNIMSPDGNT